MNDDLVKLYKLKLQLASSRERGCPNRDAACGCYNGDPKLIKQYGKQLEKVARLHCPNNDPACECWETNCSPTYSEFVKSWKN